MNHTVNRAKPYAMLMKGRPDESLSHQSLAVYSSQEYADYRAKGWKTAREFLAMVHRATQREG